MNTYAVVNPLDVPNNKYGIHIIDENDLDDAAKLVNSTGGEWGYVTIVIQDNDKNIDKWQRTFERMRKLKLIPVIRLATHAEGDHWVKPTLDDASKWAEFLDSLNWVVQNRYVILFNEPNHAKEWGGEIDPVGYATVAERFRDELKRYSSDFFVLPAGLDLAAGNTTGTMDASMFYQQVAKSSPEFFTRFDGISSHSYPNPAFSGSVYATGKNSIRGFEWEREFLKQYGLPSSIPIFITETGWVHEEGTENQNSYYSDTQIAQFYQTAFTSVWTDPYIVMISPFVLNYQGAPFDHFSWKKLKSNDYYDHYHAVLSLLKQSGKPIQIDSYAISIGHIPDNLLTNSLYYLPVTIKNIGQVYPEEQLPLTLQVVGISDSAQKIQKNVPPVEPNQSLSISIPFKTTEFETLMPIAFAIESADGELISSVSSKTVMVKNPDAWWEYIVSLVTGKAKSGI